MRAGGPPIEFELTRREREQSHAFREGQRAGRVSLIDRLRGTSSPRRGRN
jgi:hypothetical protein